MTEYVPSNTYPKYLPTDEANQTLGRLTTDPVRDSFMRYLAATDTAQEELYCKYRDYYDGDHPTKLTKRLKEFLETEKNIDFRLNVCPIVVDVLAERLKVADFEAEEIGGQDGLLWEWWQANRMDAKQKDVHTATGRDGDTYILVEWDNERGAPIYSHELAFDGSNGMVVRYHEDKVNQVKFAVKRWRVESGPGAGTVARMNVYLPHEIQKYIADGQGPSWRQFIEVDENGGELPWPLPWVDGDGQPLGVPVIPSRNNAGGYDYGKSELADILPIQNAINKTVIDELASADIAAFRLITKTAGGDPKDLAVAPGRILWDGNPETKWGQITEGNLATLSALIQQQIMRVAQISRTSMRYFQITGQIASSETQQADDAGLVSKVEDRAVPMGNFWEDVNRMAIRLSNAFGDTDIDPDVHISAVWGPFERVNKELSAERSARTAQIRAEAFEKLVLNGVNRLTAALAAGYDQQTAEDMAASGGRVLEQDNV